ncbi:unnamed protein product [Rhizoctonia solani]|uniref:F-box domain-containing protein n=1 Tax=Rhizoctonia solani TaxID=456999 RepID=A0A8H3H810_9AGAM|nr:unnamed protein product [Rhizoctonia solani]
MHDPILPIELLGDVFRHLTPSSLAATSRVCRTWQRLAFPLLYRTVYLCLATHLEQIARRICSESKDTEKQSSVVAHLRGLVLDIEYMEDTEAEMIAEPDVDHLRAMIPRLTRLSSLSWNLMFVPRDLEIFQLFQTRCPNLTSVHIWIQEDMDFHSETELWAGGNGGPEYSPALVVASLGDQFVFPNLRRFYARGCENAE